MGGIKTFQPHRQRAPCWRADRGATATPESSSCALRTAHVCGSESDLCVARARTGCASRGRGEHDKPAIWRRGGLCENRTLGVATLYTVRSTTPYFYTPLFLPYTAAILPNATAQSKK